MALAYDGAIQRLIDSFASLPGIGPKGAQRIAFYLLSASEDEARNLADAIIDVKEHVRFCDTCGNVCETSPCPICSDPARDTHTICVVADPKDVLAFEKTREYHGLYHVLHGTISPLNHIGPDDLRIRELLHRVAEEDIQEVILATNPDTEGEATAMYLARLLKPFHIRISRLAYGIPVGGQLEYIDEVTLMRALDGRQSIE